jgi:hypothetical protein
MHKARSGLAAAAARWQLVDAPEGESSLQSRLCEAERRAQDAEASAQDAQATLARTLLDAARVESVVMARMRAKSEAEIEALRSELESLKHATSPVETVLRGDQRGDADRETAAAAAPVASETTPETRTVPDSTVPDSTEALDAGVASAATAAERDAASEDVAAAAVAPALRISDEDRPEWARPQEEPVEETNVLRFLPPARIAFLAVVGIVAVISYYVTVAVMDGRDRRTVVAGGAGPHVAEGVLHDTGTDPKSIAAASATLDAEQARLTVLSKKVEALRTALTVRGRASATAMTAADRAPSRAGANWLLYMPVERPALVEYLAGRSWPGMQTAARPAVHRAAHRAVQR